MKNGAAESEVWRIYHRILCGLHISESIMAVMLKRIVRFFWRSLTVRKLPGLIRNTFCLIMGCCLFCVNDIYAETNGGRIYLFEDTSVLSPTYYPADMRDEDKLPTTSLEMKSVYSYPYLEEYFKVFPYRDNFEFETDEELYEAFCDEFSAAGWNLSKDGNNNYLLGWPRNRQDSQFGRC